MVFSFFKGDWCSNCLFVILDLKIPIMTFVNEVPALILMKLSPLMVIWSDLPYFMTVVNQTYLTLSLVRHNHPEHHELGFWGKRVGSGEGGQVHEAEPLGRDAWGGRGAGGRPPRPDPIRSSLCNSYCPGITDKINQYWWWVIDLYENTFTTSLVMCWHDWYLKFLNISGTKYLNI